LKEEEGLRQPDREEAWVVPPDIPGGRDNKEPVVQGEFVIAYRVDRYFVFAVPSVREKSKGKTGH
jgi:hypothetical protein